MTVVPAKTAGNEMPRSCDSCVPITAGKLIVPQPTIWVTASTAMMKAMLWSERCIDEGPLDLSSIVRTALQDEGRERVPRLAAYLASGRLAGLELRQIRAF